MIPCCYQSNLFEDALRIDGSACTVADLVSDVDESGSMIDKNRTSRVHRAL